MFDTCTQVLQQWNVPHGEVSDDAVLFEDIAFKKSSYLKDKKRKYRTERNQNYNPTPSNRQVTETDTKHWLIVLNAIRKLHIYVMFCNATILNQSTMKCMINYLQRKDAMPTLKLT